MAPTRRLLGVGAALAALATGGSARAGPVPVPPAPAIRRVPMAELLRDPGRLDAWLATSNPEVAAANARVRGSEAAVAQSRVLPNPTVGFVVGGLTVGGRNPATLPYRDTMNVSVGVSETVELGKRPLRAEAATLRRSAARAEARTTVLDRANAAREAMARVVYLQERARAISERLTSARSVAELEKVRLDHGDISGIDYDRLELEAMAIARDLSATEADLGAAIGECSRILLASCAEPDATMDTLDAAVPVPTLDADLGALVAARPDVRALDLERRASATDAALYRRQAIPDPTFGVAYMKDFMVVAGNQPNVVTASVSLPLPLFDHGQHLARQAEERTEELAATVRGVETRGVADARTLLATRASLERRLGALTSAALPRSAAVLASSNDAYLHGQLSLTDMLIVRREHAALVLDVIDTRYELFGVRNALHLTLGLPEHPTAEAREER